MLKKITQPLLYSPNSLFILFYILLNHSCGYMAPQHTVHTEVISLFDASNNNNNANSLSLLVKTIVSSVTKANHGPFYKHQNALSL